MRPAGYLLLASTSCLLLVAACAEDKVKPAPTFDDRIVFVDRKGVTQTMVVQVLPGVPRNDADYPALYLAERIYGGMSSARIWARIASQSSIVMLHSRAWLPL